MSPAILLLACSSLTVRLFRRSIGLQTAPDNQASFAPEFLVTLTQRKVVVIIADHQ
jgi:hypothetical protein